MPKIRKNYLDVVHLIASIGPKSYGLGPVAMNLAKEQISLGINSNIWCLDNEYDLKCGSESSGLTYKKIRRFSTVGPKVLCFSRMMERFAKKQISRDSVVHQHGIWTGISRVANIMRKVHKAPIVIAPHGSLEKWALAKSRWKKRIALALYEKNNLSKASCLYACSNQEANGFRDFGLYNPVAIIPNGISHSWIESSGDSNAFRLKFNIPSEKQIMLFLSRLAPIKGLPLLIDALDVVRENLQGWLLVVAGSDESNHKAEVIKKISELKLERHVRFVGLLLGQEKRNAFSAAEFFVLPTKREAAPIVILEALGAAVPVVTTKGAPWEDLLKYQCGWWAEISVESLAEALSDALRASPDRLRNMGERGKELVSKKYTWSQSASMTIELYEWLLGKRKIPNFVIVD